MALRGAAVDAAIHQLAGRQYWVVSRAQLVAAGLSHDSVDRRIRVGLLQPLHRGVYRVGSETQPKAPELAAVLACAGKVVVSHLSAAGLWPVAGSRSPDQPVDVIGRGTEHGRRLGVRFHHIRTLRPSEQTTLHGIPLTTVPRTLLDLAGLATRRDGALPGRDVDRAVNEAFARRLATRADLMRILADHPRHAGSGLLRDILGSSAGATRSAAEDRLLTLLRKAELPDPETNAVLNGYEIDFPWRKQQLAVEVDGLAFHSTAGRFESDRRRDAVLAAFGFRVVRLTWRQLTREREATIARLALALGP